MGDIMKMNFMKFKTLSTLSSIALVFAVSAANSACFFFLYQPEEPKGLKRLRKF